MEVRRKAAEQKLPARKFIRNAFNAEKMRGLSETFVDTEIGRMLDSTRILTFLVLRSNKKAVSLIKTILRYSARGKKR
jgi:hypothetical protein